MSVTFRLIVWDLESFPGQSDPVKSIGDIFECVLTPGCDARGSYYHWLHVARERAYERMKSDGNVGYLVTVSIVGKEYLEYPLQLPPSDYVTQRRQALIDKWERLTDRAKYPKSWS